MTPFEFALLWCAWVFAGGSPGPATLSIAGTAMNHGRTSGLIFSTGILCGSAFWGIAAALGMGAAMVANVWLFTMLKYFGAAYLLYLAVKSLRSAFSARSIASQAGYGGTPFSVFSKGALIHLTNPKAILGWGSIYAIVLPSDASLSAVFGLFGFLFSGSTLVFLGYAVLFSSKGVVAFYVRMRRVFELVFAGFFGLASLKILTARAI